MLFSVLYVKNIFNKSKQNFSEIHSYWKWLLWDNSSISFNDIIWENFELYINNELVHKWNTINSFNEKLKIILNKNSQKKIYVNIYNDNELIKTDIFKYSNFWYTINIKWIINKVRAWIIWSKWKIYLELNDYLFFDNKLLNNKINNLKEIYTENSNWEIYYNKNNQIFKVNSNKVYLSSVKDIKLNIAKVDSNINLRDSAIDIYMETKENIFFNQVKLLNTKLEKIKDKWLIITSPLEWLNYWNISKLFNNLNIKKLNISKWENTFDINISKGFLVEHLNYNSTYNTIELDEQSFDIMYWKLWTINIESKSDEIKEKPSIYSIIPWWLTENKPGENQFKILSYWNWVSFDYIWFKKELKLYLNKIFNNNSSEKIELFLKWLFVNNLISNNQKLEIDNYDSSLVNKNKFKLETGIFYNRDYITEKYISYSKYPFIANQNLWSYSSCEIKNNINLYCDDNIFVWVLWYNWSSIIIKKPNWKLYDLASNEYWLVKKNWNIIFDKSKVTIYMWALYNNVEIFNETKNIISDYKQELFPRFMWDYIEWYIVHDKVIFNVKKTEEVNSILIKSDSEFENYYVYLFKILLTVNEK
jgi:hypothetical protein